MSEHPRCETCRWWQITRDDTRIYEPSDSDEVHFLPTIVEMLAPRDGNYHVVAPDFDPRPCTSPKLKKLEMLARDELSVIDGSQYFAQIWTGPDFGCIHHETASPDKGDTP